MESMNVASPEAPQPAKLIPKLASTSLAFFVAGVNDGSLGPLIPRIRESYLISEDKIAILYVLATAPFTEY